MASLVASDPGCLKDLRATASFWLVIGRAARHLSGHFV
jgi:hypothetical protein